VHKLEGGLKLEEQGEDIAGSRVVADAPFHFLLTIALLSLSSDLGHLGLSALLPSFFCAFIG